MKCYLVETKTDDYLIYTQDDGIANLSSINKESKLYDTSLIGFFPNGIVANENCVLIVTNIMDFEKAMKQPIEQDTPIIAYMLGIVTSIEELELAGVE